MRRPIYRLMSSLASFGFIVAGTCFLIGGKTVDELLAIGVSALLALFAIELQLQRIADASDDKAQTPAEGDS